MATILGIYIPYFFNFYRLEAYHTHTYFFLKFILIHTS